MKPVFVEGRDLDDAWFQLLRACVDHGRSYLITSGSCAGSRRIALDYASGFIHHPHTRPLAPVVPPGVPAPTTDDEIAKYFVEYLLSGDTKREEHYTYGTFIVGGDYRLPEVPPEFSPSGVPLHRYGEMITVPDQLSWLIHHFKTAGYGNEHGYIQVGYPESSFAYEEKYVLETERGTSPCCRGLDFRIIDGRLTTNVIYRCIPDTTPVLYMADGVLGLRTMRDLVQDFNAGVEVSVATYNGFSPVRQASSRPAQNIVSLGLSGAPRMELTANHRLPVLQDGGVVMRYAGDISPGEYVLEKKFIRRPFKGIRSFDFLASANPETAVLRNLTKDHYNCLLSLGIHVPSSQMEHRIFKIRTRENQKKILSHPVFDDVELAIKQSTLSIPRVFKFDEGLGFFIGSWLANGWFDKQGKAACLSLAIHKPYVEQKITDWLSERFEYTPSISPKGSVRNMRVAIPALVSMMQALGLHHGARTKNVPAILFYMNDGFIKELVDGWLIGDAGCTTSPQLISAMIYLGKIVGRAFSFSLKTTKRNVLGGSKIGGTKLFQVQEAQYEKETLVFLGEEFIPRQVKDVSLLVDGCSSVCDIAVENEESLFLCGASPILVHNSWDLWGGFPTNMGGFALLNEYVARQLGNVEPGPLSFSCKSLHIYEHHLEVVRARLKPN